MIKTTLGEICGQNGGLIQTGPFGSQLHQRDYSDFGVPVVMPKDIYDGRVAVGGVSRIPETKASQLSRHKLPVNSILMPRRGEIAKRALIQEDQAGFLCGTGCIQIVVPEKILNPRYLYYFLAQRHVIEWLERNAIGTTMLNLNTKIIGGITIPLIPIHEQIQIADILSAYDDLIENNRRRIQLLEQSARLLYKEWFVRLRFPGHERVKIKNGVPEGWEKVPLGDVLILQRGFDLPLSARKTGEIPIIASTGINGFHRESKVRGPGVVTGRSGSLGKVIYVHHDYWPLNTTLWVKEFKKVFPLTAYFLLSSLKLEQYNGGVAVPTLNRNDVHKIEILCPPKRVQFQFMGFALPLYEKIRVLEKQNGRLADARDLLLPRLMNGEIAV